MDQRPLFYAEHDLPYDFFRYTQFGLTRLLEGAGFTGVEVEWLEGYFGTLAYQLSFAADNLPRDPAAYGGGRAGLALACTAQGRPSAPGRRAADALARLDLKHKLVGQGLPKNYQAVAKKES